MGRRSKQESNHWVTSHGYSKNYTRNIHKKMLQGSALLQLIGKINQHSTKKKNNS